MVRSATVTYEPPKQPPSNPNRTVLRVAMGAALCILGPAILVLARLGYEPLISSSPESPVQVGDLLSIPTAGASIRVLAWACGMAWLACAGVLLASLLRQKFSN